MLNNATSRPHQDDRSLMFTQHAQLNSSHHFSQQSQQLPFQQQHPLHSQPSSSQPQQSQQQHLHQFLTTTATAANPQFGMNSHQTLGSSHHLQSHPQSMPSQPLSLQQSNPGLHSQQHTSSSHLLHMLQQQPPIMDALYAALRDAHITSAESAVDNSMLSADPNSARLGDVDFSS